MINAVIRWFREHTKWLLIIDNADDLNMVKAFLPSAGRGHMLLTTRAHAVSHLAVIIEIDTLSPEQGALLLLRRAHLIAINSSLVEATISHQNLAKQISHELGGLPLALDQAGAYIEETAIGLSDYLQIYRSHRTKLLQLREGLIADHPESVATTWSLTFAAVEQSNPAAADLLRLYAFLAPDNIPEEIVTQGIPYLGSPLAQVVPDKLMFDQSIKVLIAYSLLHHDSNTSTFSMHRLVQAVLYDSMSRNMSKMWSERAVRVINESFPTVDVARWAVCERYLPHALFCAQWIEQERMIFPEAAHLLHKVGLYLNERGQYTEAEPLFQSALRIQEQVLGPEHPGTATTLNDLAYLYKNQGRYIEAEPLFQRSLRIQEQVLGPEHSSTATTLSNLAYLYKDQGRYIEAEPLFQRSLRIQEQVLGPEHSSTANTLHNLATLYQAQGRYEEAIPVFQHALAIQEQVLGSAHPDTAIVLNNLATLYQAQGQYEQAESLLQRALAIQEQVLGSTHPNTANTLYNLATLYQAQGQYEQAESLLQRALAIQEQVLGAEHPSTASTLASLATLYQDQGQYEQAESLLQRALAIQEQVLGSTHPSTATTLRNLAYLYKTLSRDKEAEPLFQRALHIQEQLLATTDTFHNTETGLVEANDQVDPKEFDVFLCYNRSDKEEVQKIRQQLQQEGIKPWVDEWDLLPGRPWQTALEEQIGLIKSAAVFVGVNGIGPWQREELNAFLREFVGRGCPVIPVLLQDAPLEPKLPIFLQAMQWVDFRKERPNPLGQLIGGIQGVVPNMPIAPLKPKNIRATYQPSREGNKGTIIFDLNGTEQTLEYTRYDKISHQIFFLKRKQQVLVSLVVPFATFKSIEKQEKFQIDGVDGLFIFKMSAFTSIMSVKVEVGDIEVFRT